MPKPKRYRDESVRKTTIELPIALLERLKGRAKKQGVPMVFLIEEALNNELNAIDRYESLTQVIGELKEELPKVLTRAIDSTELSSAFNSWYESIKPNMNHINAMSIEHDFKLAMELEEKKLKVLFAIAMDLPFPRDQVSYDALAILIDQNYICRLQDGTLALGDVSPDSSVY